MDSVKKAKIVWASRNMIRKTNEASLNHIQINNYNKSNINDNYGRMNTLTASHMYLCFLHMHYSIA